MNETQLESWLRSYGEAWETRDGDAAARLFTEDAAYQWGPFEEPLRGRPAIRERWGQATAGQDEVEFGFELLTAMGATAVAEWWCAFVRPKEALRRNLRGIFLLRFTEDGLCSELREWWNAEEHPL